ncbi:MAG: hypothetical protein HY737_06930 [Candidatus Omnitrophica bacterium]|nr:hypothetical protein [Candidatus Omnitrophota bacterium]
MKLRGLTLIELLIGLVFIATAFVTLMSVSLGNGMLIEHAGNVSLAVNDANRVMEELRELNRTGCASPTSNPPTGSASWDAWLAAPGGGGKSIAAIGGNAEYAWVLPDTAADPQGVTVSICWRERGRVIGECAWDGAVLSPAPGAGGIVHSPVMLSTELTCRK